MGKREAYQEKMEAQFREWGAKIAQLRAGVDQVEAGARQEYHRQLELLRAKQEAAQKKLQDLKRESEATWSGLVAGVEAAWNDLRKSLDEAVSRFK